MKISTGEIFVSYYCSRNLLLKCCKDSHLSLKKKMPRSFFPLRSIFFQVSCSLLYNHLSAILYVQALLNANVNANANWTSLQVVNFIIYHLSFII